MNLSSALNDGLIETLDGFCGTSKENFPIRKKTTYLNDSLDWYFWLAFKAGLNWEFDDSNQTSPPIDTQNIVSGTNRYKFSSFTEKIINLLKLEVANSSGTFLSLTPETLDSFGNVIGAESGRISGITGQSFDDIYINADSGTPTHYLKLGDFVYLRPKPNYNATAGLKALFNRPASKFNFVSVTVDAGTDVFTATAHGLVAGDTVIFETDGTIPTGVTADSQYYVISSGLTADAFKVSTTLGGSTIDVTNAQTSSNHSFLKTSKEPGINSMHHLTICRKAAKTFMEFNNANGEYNARLSTLIPQLQMDERTISEFFSTRDKEVRKRLQAAYQNNR